VGTLRFGVRVEKTLAYLLAKYEELELSINRVIEIHSDWDITKVTVSVTVKAVEQEGVIAERQPRYVMVERNVAVVWVY